MKLLALRLCSHDSNICYYDENKVHYIKTERHKQIKHHAFNNLWEWRLAIKHFWDIEYTDIDQIGIVIDPWQHNIVNTELNSLIQDYDLFPAACKVHRIDHHYAHSLSSWMLTDHSDVDIVIDGFGEEDVTWSIFKNSKLLEKGSVQDSGSLGIEMANAGQSMDINYFDVHDIAGKLMGLQSYGKIDKNFKKIITGYDMYNIKSIFNFDKWVQYKGDELLALHTRLDWIATVHDYVGDVLINFFKKFAKKNDTITYTGGVAQNVIWNTKLKKHFKNLIIPPHCADDGLSLGIIEALRIKNNLDKINVSSFPYIQNDISTDIPTDETITKAAELLADGKVVAWYQGNGEVGPRALGNRSILMSPLIKNAKTVINEIKNRENYRPFGGVVLDEDREEYFDLKFENPYMLYVAKIKDKRLKCITHIDKTCRIQTINKSDNPILRSLMIKFKELTGCSVLLNTSLNDNGKPIAGKPEDAISLKENSNLDYLIIGNKFY